MIKISGELVMQDAFQSVVDEIRRLLDTQIPVTLVVGGGSQITQKWREAGYGERPKGKNGVNPTTRLLMKDGVIPAYQQVIDHVRSCFAVDRANIIEPGQVKCNLVAGAGLVGSPYQIDGLHMGAGPNLNIIGFQGVADNSLSGGEKVPVNVNADDIALWIAREHRKELAEVLFLTGTGGLQDEDGELLDFLTKSQLEAILKGEFPNVTVDGGMRKKVEVALEMLAHVKKVAMVKLDRLRKELQTNEGGGTLIADVKRNRFDPLRHPQIFDEVFEINKVAGNFAERSAEELERIKANHKVCTVDGTMIGGFSLSDTVIDDFDGHLIECFWVAKKGAGISGELLKHILTLKKPVFAYSKNGIFEKHGFQKVEGKTSRSGAQLWRFDPQSEEVF